MTLNMGRPQESACDLMEEVASGFDGGWEGGEEGGGDVVTEGEDDLALLANQIHLLMDLAPIKSNGEIYSLRTLLLM